MRVLGLKKITKRNKRKTIRWANSTTIDLAFQFTVAFHIPSSIWNILYGTKIKKFKHEKTETVIYIELMSIQECMDFLCYNNFPGGAYIDIQEDESETSYMAPKVQKY